MAGKNLAIHVTGHFESIDQSNSHIIHAAMNTKLLVSILSLAVGVAFAQTGRDVGLIKEGRMIKAVDEEMKGYVEVLKEAKDAADKMPEGPDKEAVKKGLEKSTKVIVKMGQALLLQREAFVKKADTALAQDAGTVPSVPPVTSVSSSYPKREFPKDVEAEIRQYAADKWDSNYDMRDYEVKKQEKALALFNDYRVNGIAGLPPDVSSKIMRDAWDKWGINFDMCVYEADQQRKAWWKLNPFKKD